MATVLKQIFEKQSSKDGLYWDVAYYWHQDELSVQLILTDGRVVFHAIDLGPRYSPKSYVSAVQTISKYVKDPLYFAYIVKRTLDFMFPTQQPEDESTENESRTD